MRRRSTETLRYAFDVTALDQDADDRMYNERPPPESQLVMSSLLTGEGSAVAQSGRCRCSTRPQHVLDAADAAHVGNRAERVGVVGGGRQLRPTCNHPVMLAVKQMTRKIPASARNHRMLCR